MVRINPTVVRFCHQKGPQAGSRTALRDVQASTPSDIAAAHGARDRRMRPAARNGAEYLPPRLDWFPRRRWELRAVSRLPQRRVRKPAERAEVVQREIPGFVGGLPRRRAAIPYSSQPDAKNWE